MFTSVGVHWSYLHKAIPTVPIHSFVSEAQITRKHDCRLSIGSCPTLLGYRIIIPPRRMIWLFGIWVGQLVINMAQDLLGLSGVWEEAESQKIPSSLRHVIRLQ